MAKNKPNAGSGNETPQEINEKVLQGYKIKYDNTKIKGKLYKAGDIVQDIGDLHPQFYDKI